MKSEFEADLSTAQKEELQSMIAFQNLRAAKTGGIHAASKLLERKQGELADLQAKAASAKDELVSTKEALGADQQFMIELEEKCKVAVGDYDERAKMRSEELRALNEVMKILSDEDA